MASSNEHDAAAGPPYLDIDTIEVVIDRPLSQGAIARLCDRIRALLEGCDADELICDVSALVDPDAVMVDAIARLHLTARRLGRKVRFHNACGELRDLLALVGLSDVVNCEESGLEPGGQAEQREQGLGVEEEAEPPDLPG